MPPDQWDYFNQVLMLAEPAEEEKKPTNVSQLGGYEYAYARSLREIRILRTALETIADMPDPWEHTLPNLELTDNMTKAIRIAHQALILPFTNAAMKEDV